MVFLTLLQLTILLFPVFVRKSEDNVQTTLEIPKLPEKYGIKEEMESVVGDNINDHKFVFATKVVEIIRSIKLDGTELTDNDSIIETFLLAILLPYYEVGGFEHKKRFTYKSF